MIWAAASLICNDTQLYLSLLPNSEDVVDVLNWCLASVMGRMREDRSSGLVERQINDSGSTLSEMGLYFSLKARFAAWECYVLLCTAAVAWSAFAELQLVH